MNQWFRSPVCQLGQCCYLQPFLWEKMCVHHAVEGQEASVRDSFCVQKGQKQCDSRVSCCFWQNLDSHPRLWGAQVTSLLLCFNAYFPAEFKNSSVQSCHRMKCEWWLMPLLVWASPLVSALSLAIRASAVLTPCRPSAAVVFRACKYHTDEGTVFSCHTRFLNVSWLVLLNTF